MKDYQSNEKIILTNFIFPYLAIIHRRNRMTLAIGMLSIICISYNHLLVVYETVFAIKQSFSKTFEA